MIEAGLGTEPYLWDDDLGSTSIVYDPSSPGHVGTYTAVMSHSVTSKVKVNNY